MACLWGSGVAYGKMAGLWGSAKTYGEMRQACGRMGEPRNLWGYGLRGRPQNRMGEPRKRMGNTTGHGKRRRHMGRPPGRMGSQKSHQNQKYGNGTACGLARFQEFLLELRFSGRPLKCMGIIKNMAMHEPPDAACGLRIFGNIGGGAWVWEMAPSAEATPESAVAAPPQAIGMLGVPVTALPSGGLRPAGACRTVPHEKLPKRHC